MRDVAGVNADQATRHLLVLAVDDQAAPIRIERDHAPTGTTDAAQLAQGPVRIGQVLEGPLDPHRIERAVLERQRLRVTDLEVRSHTGVGGPAPPLGDHGLAHIYADRVTGFAHHPRERDDLVAGTAADIKHRVARTDPHELEALPLEALHRVERADAM